MMRLLLILFLFSVAAKAQIIVSGGLLGDTGATQVSGNINEITPGWRKDQYTDVNVQLSATYGGASITNYSWTVTKSITGTVFGTSTSATPSFDLNDYGFYNVTHSAWNGSDSIHAFYEHAFYVFPPRFDEGEADLVIDLSDGTEVYFYTASSFAGSDPAGKKVYIKGNDSNGIIQFHNLQADEGNPLYIQKSNDNTEVNLTCRSGNPHALWFSSDNSTNGCRYIIVNGYNADGTHGLNINGNNASTQVAFTDGKFTHIQYFGIDFSHFTNQDAACVAYIPTVGASNNITNWYADSLYMYDCNITNAGEEGIYVRYNNQTAQSGNVPPSGRGDVYAFINVDGCGRDAFQFGGALNFSLHDCTAQDWGLQHEGSHESAVSHNAGSYGHVYNNIFVGGEMYYNFQSGPFPWDVQASETEAGTTIIESNVFSTGEFDDGGSLETYPFFGQLFDGIGDVPLIVRNNIFDQPNAESNRTLGQLYVNTGADYITSWVNNIVIREGTGNVVTYTGPGSGSATAITFNNQVVDNDADMSGYHFADYANYDYRITNTASTAYTSGTPTDVGDTYDLQHYPMSPHVFGPYGIFNEN